MLAYCIKCKKKVELLEGRVERYRNNTPVEKGKCASCGSKVNRILSRDERLELDAREQSKHGDNDGGNA